MSPARLPKLQRQTDLIAALLRRRYSITFEELSRDVPAYAEAPSRGAMMRMFERDKDELRALGVHIQTVTGEDSEATGYLLRRRDFYLPFILVERSGTGGGAAERPGYRDLPRVVLAPDELAAIDTAALRVRRLGDPVLAADAEAAIRKLAFDHPPGTFESLTRVAPAPGATTADARTVERLEMALRNRKRASFSYRKPGRALERREVEPYGLIHVDGHWYLAARDLVRDALRRFRLEWIDELEVNGRREQSPDFEIPAGFELRELARWPWPWERGDGAATDALVTFRAIDGDCAVAARLGEAVQGEPDTRRFRVRHVPPFVRWLLSFRGDAIPVAPHGLVSAFRSSVRETRALYEQAATRGRTARRGGGASARGTGP